MLLPPHVLLREVCCVGCRCLPRVAVLLQERERVNLAGGHLHVRVSTVAALGALVAAVLLLLLAAIQPAQARLCVQDRAGQRRDTPPQAGGWCSCARAPAEGRATTP
jgi:hypothetical protein